MSHGIRKKIPGTQSKMNTETDICLPQGVTVLTEQDPDGWKTRVSFEGVYVLDGIAMQSVYHEGVLSVGINNRRINSVYQFDKDGERSLNRLSRALTQDSDTSFFVCPTHPGKLYIRHAFLQKTFSILGEILPVHQHFEAAFAVLQEHTRIDCKSGDITQKVDIRAQYRAIIDPENALSTLIQNKDGKWEVLSVSDLKTGKQIYIRRVFAHQDDCADI